jgi:hypothetical protein
MAGTPRTVIADARIEKFYASVMAAALEQKLSDGEICAILSSLIGRMIGFAAVGVDKTTLIDTAIYNLSAGHAIAPELRDAIEKLRPN